MENEQETNSSHPLRRGNPGSQPAPYLQGRTQGVRQLGREGGGRCKQAEEEGGEGGGGRESSFPYWVIPVQRSTRHQRHQPEEKQTGGAESNSSQWRSALRSPPYSTRHSTRYSTRYSSRYIQVGRHTKAKHRNTNHYGEPYDIWPPGQGMAPRERVCELERSQSALFLSGSPCRRRSQLKSHRPDGQGSWVEMA